MQLETCPRFLAGMQLYVCMCLGLEAGSRLQAARETLQPARKRLQQVRKDLASHTSHNHTANLTHPDLACQISHFTIPASQEKTPANQEKIAASQQTFPETTHRTPHTSHPRPHISHLTPHSLDLTPGCLESLAD